MLNENLMDSKDIIIAKLKLAIKEFQEYDIERKKYYSNALVELGKLKDEIEELRGINKYSKSYIAMKDENRRLKASLVGPTVYIVQFAMKLMWHGLEKVRYIPT